MAPVTVLPCSKQPGHLQKESHIRARALASVDADEHPVSVTK
jgi:hypothetical protein